MDLCEPDVRGEPIGSDMEPPWVECRGNSSMRRTLILLEAAAS